VMSQLDSELIKLYFCRNFKLYTEGNTRVYIRWLFQRRGHVLIQCCAASILTGARIIVIVECDSVGSCAVVHCDAAKCSLNLSTHSLLFFFLFQ
jgi:hypothetical protein